MQVFTLKREEMCKTKKKPDTRESGVKKTRLKKLENKTAASENIHTHVLKHGSPDRRVIPMITFNKTTIIFSTVTEINIWRTVKVKYKIYIIHIRKQQLWEDKVSNVFHLLSSFTFCFLPASPGCCGLIKWKATNQQTTDLYIIYWLAASGGRCRVASPPQALKWAAQLGQSICWWLSQSVGWLINQVTLCYWSKIIDQPKLKLTGSKQMIDNQSIYQ